MYYSSRYTWKIQLSVAYGVVNNPSWFDLARTVADWLPPKSFAHIYSTFVCKKDMRSFVGIPAMTRVLYEISEVVDEAEAHLKTCFVEHVLNLPYLLKQYTDLLRDLEQTTNVVCTS